MKKGFSGLAVCSMLLYSLVRVGPEDRFCRVAVE